MSEILSGKVIKGRGLATKMGFPTINFPYNGDSKGIFCAKVYLHGETYKAAVHLGERPTVGDDAPVCEVFILDFDGDVPVGSNFEVEIFQKIRDIKKFKSIDDLKEQIASDVEFVRMSV